MLGRMENIMQSGGCCIATVNQQAADIRGHMEPIDKQKQNSISKVLQYLAPLHRVVRCGALQITVPNHHTNDSNNYYTYSHPLKYAQFYKWVMNFAHIQFICPLHPRFRQHQSQKCTRTREEWASHKCYIRGSHHAPS